MADHHNVVKTKIVSFTDGERVERRDHVAGEEPLEIRVGGKGQDPVQVAITMRTPGHDFELAAGFLFSEGLVGRGEVSRVSYCDRVGQDVGSSADHNEDPSQFNIVTVRTTSDFDASSLKRNFFMTSSCGVCGKASIEQLEGMCKPVSSDLKVPASVIQLLPERLRSAQKLFDQTGGLHAAGVFTQSGELEVVREDVGRHNALDKVIGFRLLADQLPLAGNIVCVSGRASYELVQKALMAGAPVLCAVSAPSSLAVGAAEEFGMTLIGFARGETFNVYAHPERVA